MPDENENSLYQKQKAEKPRIEEVIPDYLSGEMRALALDFAAYLREKKMSPGWASGNSWKSSYKGKGICYVKLLSFVREKNRYSWAIALLPSDWRRYENWLESDGLMETLSANPWYCHGCGRPDGESCGRKRDAEVNGRTIEGVCGNNFLTWFCDPNAEAMDAIKRILEKERASCST